MDLDGYAIGGLAVGETHEEMYRILDVVVPHLPQDKPIYLMGVGTPENILESVERGVDFFDCVLPARNGRHGHVFTSRGKINLNNKRFEMDEKPIDEGCECPACKHYTRSYIRHLFKAKEMLGDRFCLMGNIQTKLLRFGTEQQIIDYTKKLIEICGEGGGYMMAEGCEVAPDTPMKNMKIWIETTLKYGRY